MNWPDILSRAVAALGPAWTEQLLAQAERLGLSPQTVAQRVFRLGLSKLQQDQRCRERRARGLVKPKRR